MATLTWDELLERNQKYSETKHKPQPYLSEGASPPSCFIVSCLDFRVSVEALLDIKPEEAFIIRNAGGRLRSSIEDFIFLDTMTQEQVLRHVIVIHHTDCGYTHATDEFLKTTLKAKNPVLEKEIEDLYFGTYGSGDWQRLEESVREDLRFLRKQPLIRQEAKDCAKGYVYDIKTGKLHAVVDED